MPHDARLPYLGAGDRNSGPLCFHREHWTQGAIFSDWAAVAFPAVSMSEWEHTGNLSELYLNRVEWTGWVPPWLGEWSSFWGLEFFHWWTFTVQAPAGQKEQVLRARLLRLKSSFALTSWLKVTSVFSEPSFSWLWTGPDDSTLRRFVSRMNYNRATKKKCYDSFILFTQCVAKEKRPTNVDWMMGQMSEWKGQAILLKSQYIKKYIKYWCVAWHTIEH